MKSFFALTAVLVLAAGLLIRRMSASMSANYYCRLCDKKVLLIAGDELVCPICRHTDIEKQ